MNLYQWAIKWGVPPGAISDLKILFGTPHLSENKPDDGVSEAAVQNKIRLEASKKGGRLWRNNVGATVTENGDFIRFGLANDSTRMNRTVKSSDLIGVMPVAITPIMVGTILGVFVAREVKKSDWAYTGTPRELAQLKYLELVASMGGNACFTVGEGTL